MIKDEQAERIKENMAEQLDTILEDGDFQAFEELFEDRDPFEFM